MHQMIPPPAADPLLAWRQRTVTLLLRVFVLASIPAILFDTVYQIYSEHWPLFLVNLSIFMLVLGSALARGLSAQVRGGVIVVIMLVGGLIGNATFGFFSIHPMTLVASMVLAVLLLPPRAVVVIGLLATLGLTLIFAAFGLGLLPYPLEPVRHATDVPVLVMNWILIVVISIVLVVMVGSLVQTLKASLQTTHTALAELTRVNASLETVVERRTAELQQTAALLAASQRLARVGGLAYHQEGNTFTWTDELYRIHEVPPGATVDHALIGQLYPGQSWEAIGAAFRALIATGTPYALEVPAVTLSGRPIWVYASGEAESHAGAVRFIGAVQDITARKETELALAQQLRYAEALARCSRLLLTPVATAAAYQQALAQALAVVREAAGGDRITLARHAPREAGAAQAQQSYQVLAAVEGPGLPPERPPTPEEIADLPPEMDVWRLGGGTFNGPVAGRFPAHPAYQRFSDANRIQSAFFQALAVGEGGRWGRIALIDHHQARSWGAGAALLIQTAAEMIVTFVEGWEATQALQEREALLRSITDALPSGYLYQVVQRRDGSYVGHTYLSGGVEPLFGLTPAQIRADATLLHTTLHPEDRARVDAADQEALRSLTLFEVETRARKADGSIAWFQFRALPQLRPDGMVRWNGLCLEITTRKEAELALAQQLRYAEALARCSQILLVEGAAVPAWEPVVQQALATLRIAVGCTRLALWLMPAPDAATQAEGVVVADQHPDAPPFRETPLDDTEVAPALRAAALRGEVVAGALDELFPASSSIHTHFALNGLRSLAIAAAQISGVWRGQLIAADVAASRRWHEPAAQLLRTGLEMITAFIHQGETARALRAREAQLRAVGDNLPRGFIYQLRRDAAWRPTFTYLSSGVAQILGVSVEEGLRDASAVYATVAPDDQARIAAQERISATAMLDVEVIARHERPGGEQRWIYLRSRPRPAEDDSVVWDGLTLDITERQRAAAELERSRDAAEAAARAKSTFLATMSHEIRTPLNAVIGMAALLQETSLTAEQRGCVDSIRTGGQALLAVISDILDFSRIESGHVELQAAPFDLQACLAATVELVAHGGRQKGLAVRCTCDPSVPRAVVGDEARLRQVLLNLLGNAVKFTSQGEVALHAVAAPQGGQTALVTITVRDTGIGMTPAQLAQIFEPFVQAERTTALRYGGTGLGLAISHQLVTLMGGAIDVTSASGGGSTFSVSIPFPLAAVAALPSQAAPPVALSRRLRVLVAEDNPLNQAVVQRIVAHLGHAVTVVPDGQAAVEAVSQQVYDVVLMDVQMPGLDGEAATRQIRQRGAGIAQPHIIALTASALAGDRQRLLQAGMDDYLSKPVQPAELQQALAHVPRLADEPHEARGEALPLTPSEALIDWAVLGQLLGSGPESEMVATIRRLFAETLAPQLDAIDAALRAGDAARLRVAAHRLRGGCLQIGARALAALGDQLERADNLIEATSLATRLRTCYGETLTLLRERFSEP